MVAADELLQSAMVSTNLFMADAEIPADCSEDAGVGLVRDKTRDLASCYACLGEGIDGVAGHNLDRLDKNLAAVGDAHSRLGDVASSATARSGTW